MQISRKPLIVIGLKWNGQELQEKAIKLTHQAEELHAKRFWCAEEIRAEAYALLEKCGDHLDAVDQRAQLLSQSIVFFRVAQTATNKLDQLEVQLTAHQIPAGSAQLAQLHAQVSRALEDATAPALHHGYALLELVGRGSPGAEVSIAALDSHNTRYCTINMFRYAAGGETRGGNDREPRNPTGKFVRRAQGRELANHSGRPFVHREVSRGKFLVFC